MPKESAGILLYRTDDDLAEVFLVHPGGPFWAKKDAAAWSIPKGELEEGEDRLATAEREFREETGLSLPAGERVELELVRQAGGKVVYAWAVEGSVDPGDLDSNSFEMEWPPRSGRVERFPEVDRAGWFSLAEAREKLHRGQVGLVDQLERLLASGSSRW